MRDKLFFGILVGLMIGFVGGWFVQRNGLLTRMGVVSQTAEVKGPKTTGVTEGYYHNDFGKFSIKLPEGVRFLESYDPEGSTSESMSFGKENGISLGDLDVTITTFAYKERRTLDSWEIESPNFMSNSVANKQNIKIGGVAARKYNLLGMFASEEYRLISPDGRYSISMRVSDSTLGKFKKDQDNLVKEILETWKFD